MRSFFLLLFLFYFYSLHTQTSFVKRLIIDSEFPFANIFLGFSVNNENLLGIVGEDGRRIRIGVLNGSGEVINSLSIVPPITPFQNDPSLGLTSNYLYLDTHHLVVSQSPSIELYNDGGRVLIQYNEYTQTYWAKSFRVSDNFNAYTPLIQTEDFDKLFVGRYTAEEEAPQGLGVSLLDFETGTAIWNKQFWTNNEQSFNMNSVTINNASSTFTFSASNYQNPNLYLTIIDILGQIKASTKILNDNFVWQTLGVANPDKKRLHTDANGNIYLTGKVKISDNINNYGEQGIYEMLIIKFDSQLNVIWSKTISAEKFSVYDFTISTDESGETIFAISTKGNFPIISGKLDSNGNLIYQRGYDFVFHILDVDNSGTVYMMSVEPDFENSVYIQTLSKTLPDGTIPTCPQYPSCVEVNDIEIQTEPVTWYSGELPPMDDFEVVIGKGDITSFDVCDPLVYPTPDFSLPDTVCQFTCLQPEELNNQLANSVTWQISGPGLDTVVQDTSFQRCFDVPGTYYFDHQVWVLGCFTQQYDTLVVLPDDLYTTIGDTLACGLPLDLYLPASRLLQDAVWAHGALGVEVSLDTPGVYSFLATDGYCNVSDTITLSDIYEQYPLPWLSPVDTTICSADFPFRLSADSPYTGTFRLDGLPFKQEAVITIPGNYQLELEISHCTEWTNVQVDSIDCTARIYLPNAFSPNNDGHNDRWFPQGYNFESLQLQIFNRWGGLVYDDRSAAPAWDGRVAGEAAEAGVYVAVLCYYNPLRDERGKVTQEVVVLR